MGGYELPHVSPACAPYLSYWGLTLQAPAFSCTYSGTVADLLFFDPVNETQGWLKWLDVKTDKATKLGRLER